MLAYPGGLTWCRKPENSWKTTDLGWKPTILPQESRWLSGRVSDSGARGRGFKTCLRRVVSLSKTLYPPKVLVHVGTEPPLYPGSGGSVPTWLKNCWLRRYASTQTSKPNYSATYLNMYLGANMGRRSGKRVFYHCKVKYLYMYVTMVTVLGDKFLQPKMCFWRTYKNIAFVHRQWDLPVNTLNKLPRRTDWSRWPTIKTEYRDQTCLFIH